MKAFEEIYPKPSDSCHYTKISMWNERRRVWKAALEWCRVKVENYTPEDVCYFIDEELE